MKRPSDHQKKGIGSTLDSCSWDYTTPPPQRRFFLNPLSSFFGDFPWEGRKSKGAGPSTANPADGAEPDLPG